MYRIDNQTAATVIPTPDAVGPKPNGFFTPGNPLTGVPPTILTSDWANAVQEELCYVITQAGLTLSKSTRTQLDTAIRSLVQGGSGKYAASTTSPNTYVATLSPAPSAYVAGLIVFIKFTNANTNTTPTINLNGLGAKTIVTAGGGALYPGDIRANTVAALIYDGTNFQLLNYIPTTIRQTYTPAVTVASGTAPTYTGTVNGNYYVNGNLCFVDIFLQNTAGGTAGSGAGLISVSLPINSAVGAWANTGNSAYTSSIGYALNSAATRFMLVGLLSGNSSTIRLGYWSSFTAISQFTGGDQSDTSRNIALHFYYDIA